MIFWLSGSAVSTRVQGGESPFAGGALAPVSSRSVRGDVTGLSHISVTPNCDRISHDDVTESMSPWVEEEGLA
jgi:hypothetical protein